ncbi:hypothetical protein [uncultured Eubacterium sp.]|uniref:hypothetical protein n=1 Tax=uncultured Eubacterium sp. TaxID=165185 RepID=UPI002635EA51|nr:hypothetical protein [uncultured Eubacterium sp.]
MFYSINNLKNPSDSKPDSNFVAIMPLAKAGNYDIINSYIPKIPTLFTDFHFSKIEIFEDFIFGC